MINSRRVAEGALAVRNCVPEGSPFMLMFPAKWLINPVLSVPVDPAVEDGMLPAMKGEELPENVQMVVLASP